MNDEKRFNEIPSIVNFNSKLNASTQSSFEIMYKKAKVIPTSQVSLCANRLSKIFNSLLSQIIKIKQNYCLDYKNKDYTKKILRIRYF